MSLPAGAFMSNPRPGGPETVGDLQGEWPDPEPWQDFRGWSEDSTLTPPWAPCGRWADSEFAPDHQRSVHGSTSGLSQEWAAGRQLSPACGFFSDGPRSSLVAVPSVAVDIGRSSNSPAFELHLPCRAPQVETESCDQELIAAFSQWNCQWYACGSTLGHPGCGLAQVFVPSTVSVFEILWEPFVQLALQEAAKFKSSGWPIALAESLSSSNTITALVCSCLLDSKMRSQTRSETCLLGHLQLTFPR